MSPAPPSSARRMGLEAAYSTRALRHLAHRLVGAGWAALRIDYAATGDSAGTWTDPDLVDEWLGNVRVAHRLRPQPSACRGPRWWGSGSGPPWLPPSSPAVARWTTWCCGTPVRSGRAFLREQTALAAFRATLAVEWGVQREGEAPARRRPSRRGRSRRRAPCSRRATVEDLEAARHRRRAASPWRPGNWCCCAAGGESNVRPTERLALPHVESAEIDGQEALFEDKPVTPWATLDRIATWLGGQDGPMAQIALPEPHATAVHRADGCGRRPGAGGRAGPGRALRHTERARGRPRSVGPDRHLPQHRLAQPSRAGSALGGSGEGVGGWRTGALRAGGSQRDRRQPGPTGSTRSAPLPRRRPPGRDRHPPRGRRRRRRRSSSWACAPAPITPSNRPCSIPWPPSASSIRP